MYLSQELAILLHSIGTTNEYHKTIPAADSSYCLPCVYITRKSAELRLNKQELVEWVFTIFSLSLIPRKSTPPERFFLRGISLL